MQVLICDMLKHLSCACVSCEDDWNDQKTTRNLNDESTYCCGLFSYDYENTSLNNIDSRNNSSSNLFSILQRGPKYRQASATEFTRSIQRVIQLQIIPDLNDKQRKELYQNEKNRLLSQNKIDELNSLRQEMLVDILGVALTTTTRRDYRVCVEYLRPGSRAESLGILVGALVVSLDGQSLKTLAIEQVEERIQNAWWQAIMQIKVDQEMNVSSSNITIEFSQRVQEMNVDKNPYAMTSFPQPQGTRLPGVSQFHDVDQFTVHSNSGSEDDSQDGGRHRPPRRKMSRQNSRSIKHFWMSDRSAKACYNCEQLFTFFRRRHHCRSCGHIFCHQCCARLPQSFGDKQAVAGMVSDNDSISRLRKQLVCHTCLKKLREGRDIDANLTANAQQTGAIKPDQSPPPQTLLLMPLQIVEAMEKSSATINSPYRQLENGDLFDKDEISDGLRAKERMEVLFSMFPKVQIVASVLHLAHQPRIHASDGLDDEENQRVQLAKRLRTYSEASLSSNRNGLSLHHFSSPFHPSSDTILKRSSSWSELGNSANSSVALRWTATELRNWIYESRRSFSPPPSPMAALSRSQKHSSPMKGRPRLLSRHKTVRSLSFAIDYARFGFQSHKRNPFYIPKDGQKSRTTFSGQGVRNNLNLNVVVHDPYADSDHINLLAMVGLAQDATDEMTHKKATARRKHASSVMQHHAQVRLEERIFGCIENSQAISRLPILVQYKWMQLIYILAQRAAESISCLPNEGDTMDIMDYVRIKCLQGGQPQDSFFIDGVLVHKSLARKGMRNEVKNPRILLLGCELDYQRNSRAIASLEFVAGQEEEYMHIVAEKIMTLQPDIVLFSGHIHRVAEEILFKENVAVVKNVRLVDLQRIARSTGATVLTSYDHLDSMKEDGIVGTCKRFYVMESEAVPKSVKHIPFVASGIRTRMEDGITMPHDALHRTRKKRPQKQNIIFEGGIPSKTCTICLRGGASPEIFDEVTKVLSTITRAAYNMRLQRALLIEFGVVPSDNDETINRSVAEEWFAKASTSLYVSLKSNSLSLRAALKETQAMCKFCKNRTKYQNISSLRVLQNNSSFTNAAQLNLPINSNIHSGTTQMECTCQAKSAEGQRDRILFSTCWSTLEGKTASKAEMMCIDFYSLNDCSLGHFLDTYCFNSSNLQFKRAFANSKLTFSHDTSRIVFRVKDIRDMKDASDFHTALAAAAKVPQNQTQVRTQETISKLRSESSILMWSRRVGVQNSGKGYTTVSYSKRYVHAPADVLNYSFGKFLEDLFYGKAMRVDIHRFPHLSNLKSGSRDPSLIHYFSRGGRIVSIECEPVEPVLHVALQPVLWQNHLATEWQAQETIEDVINELCELALQVHDGTIAKVEESVHDAVTPQRVKQQVKILRNEVHHWYSCCIAKIMSDPPADVFAKNRELKNIYQHAADWSMRITEAMAATVKLTKEAADQSPMSALPRAWYEQLSAGVSFGNTFISTSTTGDSDNNGGTQTKAMSMAPVGSYANLDTLATFARSLAKRNAPQSALQLSPSQQRVTNEVSNTLNARMNSMPVLSSAEAQYPSTASSISSASGSSSFIPVNIHAIPKDYQSSSSDIFASSSFTDDHRELDDIPEKMGTSSSFGSFGNIKQFSLTPSTTQTGQGSKTFKSLQNFRLTMTDKNIDNAKSKANDWSYLTIPNGLISWHPALPTFVQDVVVLVNSSQPTSVVAYTLSSKEYTKRLKTYIKNEQSNVVVNKDESHNSSLSSAASSVDNKNLSAPKNITSSTESQLLALLRSATRNNIDHVFVDENPFQPATRFTCKSYYAMQFHALRKLYYGGDRKFIESLCGCEHWEAHGGKSGAAFLKTRDQRFIAKAIPEIELQMFLEMACAYFGYMANTFENNLATMLSKVLGIYKVSISSENKDQKLCILVMENLLYGREVTFSFDLKGKMEGRYKHLDKGKKGNNANLLATQTNHGNVPVLWDRNFVEMSGGIPLSLQESAMSLLLSAAANDTNFLSSVQATDYSMLVGYDTRNQEVVACIIDYIHKYDLMKMMEHAGKRLIQDEREITVLNPNRYRKRFCVAMTKYFTTIPSRYTKVTTVVRDPTRKSKPLKSNRNNTDTNAKRMKQVLHASSSVAMTLNKVAVADNSGPLVNDTESQDDSQDPNETVEGK